MKPGIPVLPVVVEGISVRSRRVEDSISDHQGWGAGVLLGPFMEGATAVVSGTEVPAFS